MQKGEVLICILPLPFQSTCEMTLSLLNAVFVLNAHC